MADRRSYHTRVYSNQPHAHLLESGHRQVMNPLRAYKYIGSENSNTQGIKMGRMVKPGKNRGRTIGRVSGRLVMKKAGENFAPTFCREAESAIDDIIARL